MRFSKTILTAAAALALPLFTQADPVIPSPTLSIAGFTFNDFTCSLSGHGWSTPGSCQEIKVNTITNPGTGISFTSGFTSANDPDVTSKSESFKDAVLTYHVSSGTAINDVGLEFNGTFEGYAISSVTETVHDSAGAIVGFAQVFCNPGDLGGCQLSDNVMLNGAYNNLYITKDINVTSFLGESQISYIDQTFSPDAAPTPEPGSVALLGSGLVGVAALLRRRKLAVKA